MRAAWWAVAAAVAAAAAWWWARDPGPIPVDWAADWGDGGGTVPGGAIPGGAIPGGGGDDGGVRPFRIAVPDDVVADLHRRLDQRRGFPAVDGAGWDDGMPPRYLAGVLAHWRKGYDWRHEEARLNELPQWTTRVDGLSVHFVHLRSKARQKGAPLLLLHGWPGSFVEFARVGPMLADPDDGSAGHDVVIPSLPGYGFSEPARQKGLGPFEVAVMMVKLMRRLHPEERFVVQGGDWGSIVAQCMARVAPAEISALHLNFQFVLIPWWGPLHLWLFGPADERPRLFPLVTFAAAIWDSTGYLHEHSTKPYTVGTALSDSPAGLAAWILEKFHEWTDRGQSRFGAHDGADVGNITIDDLLTNVMVYWVTNTAASSVRLYREAFLSSKLMTRVMMEPVEIPVGVADFPREILPPATAWLPTRYRDIVSHHRAAAGGHFAALERPDELVGAVRKFLVALRARGLPA